MAVIPKIYHRPKTELDLEQSQEQYCETYNRAEFYKDFFTHDINNILQGILSAQQLIKIYKDSHQDQQRVDKLLEMIREQVDRGANLVSNSVISGVWILDMMKY